MAALPALMAAQAPPDFSGTWKLDTLRSRFGKDLPAPQSLILQVKQHDATVDVKMTTVTHDGESTEDFLSNAAASAPTATWDGDHLVLQCQHNTPDGPQIVTRRLKRGEKDKIMTAVLTVKDRSGESTAYEFYVKE
jgi:hypothetical protein